MVGLFDAVMVVAKPEAELWYRNNDGEVVSGRPIAADANGVLFDDKKTTRSLQQVSLYKEGVLRSV
jgi:hypothetical protein